MPQTQTSLRSAFACGPPGRHGNGKGAGRDNLKKIRFSSCWQVFLACGLRGVSAQCGAAPESIEAQASGVFLNANGDVLTARHAVAGCRSLYVIKDGQV